MAKKVTTKQAKAPVKAPVKAVKAPTKVPKKAVQVKISVKPVKNPMIGEKAMPMIPSGKKAMPNVKQMMASEKMIEKKTATKPKTAAEKKLEQKISKQTGKTYKGKR